MGSALINNSQKQNFISSLKIHFCPCFLRSGISTGFHDSPVLSLNQKSILFNKSKFPTLKKTTTLQFLLFTFLLFQMLTRGHAADLRADFLFLSTLEGSQVVPPVTTNASGVGSFLLNVNRDSISVNVSMVGALATSAGIYFGSEGTAGTLLIDLTPNLQGNRIATSITGTDLTTNLADLLKGKLFLQITTNNHPSGALRGQIELAADWNLVAELNGGEAVPSNTTDGYGLGSFDLSMDKERLSFKIICQNLSGAISTAKLHIGAPGIAGAEVEDLSTYINGNTIIGSIPASSDFLNNVFLQKIYLNIRTAAYPDGQLRAQLRLYKGLALEVFAEGQKMVPPINTPAKAIGVFRLSPTLDSLYYEVVATDISSSLNFMHFHIGNAGQAYGGLQLDFSSSIQGNHIKGFIKGAAVSNSAVKRLLMGELALIFHTGARPNGEIRGQSSKFAHEGYTFQLEGNQVVPAVSTPAYGSGVVSVDRKQERAHYHWVAGDLSSTATKAQLHHAPAGAVGPMIYDMSTVMTASGSQATAKGVWKPTDATPFTSTYASLLSEDMVYLNISTAQHPDGELRGQIRSEAVFYQTTTSILGVLEGKPTRLNIYPNPTNDRITVKTDHLTSNTIQVYLTDLLGRIVFSAPYEPSQEGMLIDLGKLQSGIYLLQLTDGQGIITEMVIRQ